MTTRMIRRTVSGGFPALLVLLLLAFPSQAVVVIDDPVKHEVVPGSDYDMVGYLDSAGGTSAVLIDPYHILTAAHAVGNIVGKTFQLTLPEGVEVYQLVQKLVHPTIDLAVVELDRSTDLPGYELYRGRNEAGMIGTIAGYGYSGVTVPDPVKYPVGRLRIGYNRINAVTQNSLIYRFDPPSAAGSLGADKEAIFAPGDSGGPTFVDDGGVLKVAGIHVSVTNLLGGASYPTYGDYGYDIRVSSYADWIFQQVPEPASLCLVAAGGLLLTICRPRGK